MFHILQVSNGSHASTAIVPSEAFSGQETKPVPLICGWMPCAEVAIVTGAYAASKLNGAIHSSGAAVITCSHFAVHSNGSVLGQCTGLTGLLSWSGCHNSIPDSEQRQNLWTPAGAKASASTKAAWEAVEPLLHPFWSPGSSGHVPAQAATGHECAGERQRRSSCLNRMT